MRHMTSVLTSKWQLHFIQQEGESQPEFDGRVLCAIEEAITETRGPTPAGTRWVEWWHYGHAVREFMANGLGNLRESTGERYQNRTLLLPGLYDLGRARAVLGLRGGR